MGVRKVGLVARTLKSLVVAGIRGDEAWVTDPDWVREEGIRTVAVHPLSDADRLLGVVAVFDRRVLDAPALAAIQQAADLGAPILSTARELERIEVAQRARHDAATRLLRRTLPHEPLPPIVAASAAGQRLLHQLEAAAESRHPVLVTGEPGSGKTLLARHLHSRRGGGSGGIFVVDCQNLTTRSLDALLSDLGAAPSSDLTTLVFEDVSALAASVQARLVSIVQASEPGFGVVATSSVDLRIAVDEGRFDAPLYYRLSGVVMEVPPLRDRGADIVSLAEAFAGDVAARLGVPVPVLGREATESLKSYSWPGNVAELAALVERAVRGARGGSFRLEWTTAQAAAPDREGDSGQETPILTRAALRQRERASIEAALRRTGGRVFGPDGAAVLLGMKATTLASRIKALGVRTRRRREVPGTRD